MSAEPQNDDWEGGPEPEQQADPQPERAMVPVKQKAALVANDRGYIAPTTIEEAVRLANAVIAGRLAPNSYNNDPGMITLGIMSALEAGLPPLYGLRQIAIIQGRPVIWGDAAMALVQSQNLIDEYHEEEIGTKPQTDDLTKWPDDFGYRVRIKRRHQRGEYVGEFTVGHAKRAKLWLNPRKTPWMEHPQRMLKIRARAFPLRDGFADGLAGLAIREEVEDTFEVGKPVVTVELSDQPKVEAPPMPEEEASAEKAADGS